MSIDPSAVARPAGSSVGFGIKGVASRLRWVILIPTAALGFAAAAALGDSGSKVDAPASFFGPASTASAPKSPPFGTASTTSHHDKSQAIHSGKR